MECKCFRIKDKLIKCWFCLGLDKIEKLWNNNNKRKEDLNRWSY